MRPTPRAGVLFILGLVLLPSLVITGVIGFFVVRMTWRAAKTVPE